MALAGTGAALGDKIADLIIDPEAPAEIKNRITLLWENIGAEIVAHIVANATVPPGIPISSPAGPGSTTGQGSIA